MQQSSKASKKFSFAPFQLPPLHRRCLRRCWCLHRGRWLLGPDSCGGVFLRPGIDNQNISIWASTTFKQETMHVFLCILTFTYTYMTFLNDALFNKTALT